MIERRAGFCTAFFSKIEGEQMEQGKSRLAQEFEKREKSQLVRLNKYISEAGLCSRREADRLIEAGRVQVDGKTAVPGQKVSDNQEILVDGKSISKEEEMVLLAVNKPRGVVCTTDKRWGDQTVEELIHYPKRVFYMGRLDKDSEGLLLMTNNGEILNKMMRAGNYHEKEYLVRVNRPVTEAFLSGMAKGGIPVQEQQTRPCKVEKTGERTFRIILTQGLNRQIRRMCEYFGYQVVKLKRIRIMNIMLGDLPTGSYREISREEQEELYRRIQGSSNQPVRENRGRREEWKKKDSE
jgi:23S rRNA pseudouridine2604 synthase